METKISEEEFMRLQNQLIDLRTANYALEERCAGHIAKNKEMSLRAETLEKECNNLKYALKVSGKVKNVDLLSHNEALQQKLQNQEDDFRLQNETLIKELTLLVAENKKLQSRVSSDVVEADAYSEVKRLKEEAIALERALSEERLRSANEISKLRTTLRIFMEGVDEDIQNDLCPGLESKIYESTENMEITGIGSPIECMIEGDDSVISDNEETELMEDAQDICIEYSDSQSEVNKIKEKLKVLQSKWDLEIEVLADLVKTKKENYESLKTKLSALEGRFYNCRMLCDQMIHGTEKQLYDAMEECTKLKEEKSQLEGHILALKKEMSENSLEGEIVHSQLVETRTNMEEMKCYIGTLKADSGSLTESYDELKKEMVRKNQIIDDLTCKHQQVVAQYEDKRQIIEKSREGSEHKLREVLEALQELEGKYNSLEKTSELKEKALKELQQSVADLSAERALNEKKGLVICRDLKRQLVSERLRAEKLLEKLRELDSSTIKQESAKAGDAEVTSISSWSLMSGNPNDSSAQESHVTTSPENINGNVFPQGDLVLENKNLLDRVTSLQEEKWVLEEKINHLEQGSAAMAEDLMQKSELIKFYCMDSRQGDTQQKKGGKKLSEFLKGSEGESVQESFAAMQRMLEEMLTKNMYLQRDIKHLSQELETLRLSGKTQ